MLHSIYIYCEIQVVWELFIVSEPDKLLAIAGIDLMLRPRGNHVVVLPLRVQLPD